jgi:CDGSH-type Zn-finger protein
MTKINAQKNGPILLYGIVELAMDEGKIWISKGGPPLALCRCGLSDNKPLCDGSHTLRNGYEGFEGEGFEGTVEDG